MVLKDELNELCADSGDDEAASTNTSAARPPLVAQASLDVESKMRVLQERLAMYDTAEKNANQSGDSMKARRSVHKRNIHHYIILNYYSIFF